MRKDDRLARIEALYRREFGAFVRVARGIVGDPERALEAVHDGFADAIRARSRLRDEEKLEAWVWRAVINAARKATRRPLVEVTVAEAESAVDPPAVRALPPLLALLPERQRLIVFLRYYADLDYRRIAEVVGVEVGTVSAALATAHRSVRRSLEEVQTR
jgi:RNA polymerase sigma factor (sigma-70 family)